MHERPQLDYDPTSPELPDNFLELNKTDKLEILFVMRRNGHNPGHAIQNFMARTYGGESQSTAPTIAELSGMFNFLLEKFDADHKENQFSENR